MHRIFLLSNVFDDWHFIRQNVTFNGVGAINLSSRGTNDQPYVFLNLWTVSCSIYNVHFISHRTTLFNMQIFNTPIAVNIKGIRPKNSVSFSLVNLIRDLFSPLKVTLRFSDIIWSYLQFRFVHASVLTFLNPRIDKRISLNISDACFLNEKLPPLPSSPPCSSCLSDSQDLSGVFENRGLLVLQLFTIIALTRRILHPFFRWKVQTSNTKNAS